MAIWRDIAVWRGPTSQKTVGGMSEIRGLVIHIAEGSYEGTIQWQKGPNNVSSHFVLDLDGTLAQVIDTADAAWTQRAGNGHWLSVECAGFTPNALKAAQVATLAKLFAKIHIECGVPLQMAINPLGHGLGHHSMGTNGHNNPTDTWTGPTWGHELCPGPAIVAQKPAILARATAIVGGTTVPPATGGDEMAFRDDPDAMALVKRVEALFLGEPTAEFAPKPGDPMRHEPNSVLKLLNDIKAAVGKAPALPAVNFDAAALAAALGPAVEAALAKPAVLAAIAKAVNDEEAKRQAA